MKLIKLGVARGAMTLLSVAFASITTTSFAAEVDVSLQAWLASHGHPFAKKDVLVYLKDSGASVKSLAEDMSVNKKYVSMRSLFLRAELTDRFQNDKHLWATRAVTLRVGKRDLRKLMLNASVEAIEENQIITLDKPKTPSETPPAVPPADGITYGLKLIHADKVQAQGRLGDGIVVGVVDTGVDQDHPDLKGKIIAYKDFSGDNDLVDYNTHGTHVCGTIVGGKASTAQIGVAPNAKIVMGKAFNKKGGATMDSLLGAMEFMLDPDGNPQTKDQPRVVSNSWGASTQFSKGFQLMVQKWRENQIFPNFAAGNSGSGRYTINAPGSYPESFAVGAVDSNSVITKFSSRGPTVLWKGIIPKFLTKPDISAPGFEVFSSLPNKSYGIYSGTSMATPHVAGVIALTLQANPSLTVEQTMEILTSTALDRDKAGMDNSYGYGIVQADLAVQKALAMKGGKGTWVARNSDSSSQDKVLSR